MTRAVAWFGPVLAAVLTLAAAGPLRAGDAAPEAARDAGREIRETTDARDARDAHAAREAQCRAWAATAFPSGLEETSCRFEFALPSPFLFVCARGQDRGFDSDLQRAACADFFARSAARARAGYVRPLPGAAPSEG